MLNHATQSWREELTQLVHVDSEILREVLREADDRRRESHDSDFTEFLRERGVDWSVFGAISPETSASKLENELLFAGSVAVSLDVVSVEVSCSSSLAGVEPTPLGAILLLLLCCDVERGGAALILFTRTPFTFPVVRKRFVDEDD